MDIIKSVLVWGAGVAMVKVAILSSLIEIGYSINSLSFTITLIFGITFLAIAVLIKGKE